MKNFIVKLQSNLKTVVILALLTMGASSAWAGTSTTVYYAVPAGTVGCYTVKLNVNYKGDGDDWHTFTMSKTGNTKNGNIVYSCSYTDAWNGVGCMQFQLYNGGSYVSQQQPIGSWTSVGDYNGQVYVHNTGWQTASWDASYTVYFVDSNDWGATIKAYAYNGSCDYNAAWGGADMTSTDKKYSGHSIYSITLNKRYANVVFNCNGNDGKKTGDLTCYSNSGKMYNGSSWVTLQYDVKLDQDGGSGGTSSIIAACGSAMPGSKIAPTRTGYTFGGYYTAKNGGGTQYYTSTMTSATNWPSNGSGPTTLYAKWTAHQTTVSLSFSGEAHYGSGAGATTSVTATYGSAMPDAPITVPTAATYYGFDGYYSEQNGEGTKYYNADGSSAHEWDIDAATQTLYAYFTSPKISVGFSAATGEGSAVNASAAVTATATLTPEPEGTTVVCWRFMYNNGNPYPGVTFSPDHGKVVGFTSPATPGTYKVAAILHTGSTCGSGTVLDSIAAPLYVASSHTVTVKYVCDGEEIADRTYKTGKPLEWTEITAPDKTEYSFSKWKAGDGITIEGADDNGEKASATINFKARYDGTLTAIYTKRKMIYFWNTLGWSNVYVYFYGVDGYWDSKGAGANGYASNTMTRIGTSDVWYFEYTGTKERHVAFTKDSQAGYQNFHSTEAVYPTRNDYSYGFNEGSPMFVPLSKAAQTAENLNSTSYYSRGYWVNYLGENIGYTLLIYDAAGNQELKRIRFTPSANKTMPMKVVVDLEANHSYQYEVLRDDGIYYKYNSKTLNESNKGPYTLSTSTPSKGTMQTNGAGDYTFTLGYDKTNLLTISLTTPIAVGDFRIVYSDNATWSRGVAHTRGTWIMSSHPIKHCENGVDTVSFFVSKNNSPEIRWQKATAVGASSVTWGTSGSDCGSWITDIASGVSESGVYNFRVVQNAAGTSISSITNIGAYTGNYYIRCDAANSKWDNYATDPDHIMTYSPFSESDDNAFGPKYSHYNCQWCVRGTNIKYCVANDYSPSISDTLAAELAVNRPFPENTDAAGTLKSDGNADPTSDIYSANVRFMWNRKTNVIRRAYVASATTAARQFLVLKGCSTIKNSDGTALGGEGESASDKRAIFKDDQDFIYERMITIQPNTRVKVYACYAKATPDPSAAQYFAGEYEASCSDPDKSVRVIGGTGSSFEKVRVLYDFKTNRLIMAWMPTEGEAVTNTAEPGTEGSLKADVMVIRDHQEGADAITFGENGKLSDVKFVYGVMRFNRWTLNNRKRGQYDEDDQNPDHCTGAAAISTYHPVLPIERQKSIYERALYFISFPFDVNLSDVFGINDYGKNWVISEYNGKRRAERGYFMDNCFNEDCTNWDYIWDRTDKVLHAYEGYLLSLDLDRMQYDDTLNFWVNHISQKELFFPSAEKMGVITTTNVTIPELGDAYKCSINYDIPEGDNPEGDRRMKDSYWRCIGTPSYAPYGAVVRKTGPSGDVITWETNRTWTSDFLNHCYLYEWNVDDNSLSVQSTSHYNFKPMHAYLVQNGNAIYWSSVSATPASIVRRQRKAETKDLELRLTLETSTRFEDQTFVRLSDNEQVTDTFDFGQDLSKEGKIAHSNIYTYIGTERVAANSMPIKTETTTVVKLGLKIREDGEYTISLPDGSEGIGVDLIDTETNERINLSAGYICVVNLTAGEHNDRFLLEISPIPAHWQGIEEVNTGSSDERARKLMIDGNLYIVRDGQMFDARGTRVK